MKWTKDGEYAIRCDPWRITKNWTATGWLYALIRDKRVIGTASSADECKRLAK